MRVVIHGNGHVIVPTSSFEDFTATLQDFEGEIRLERCKYRNLGRTTKGYSSELIPKWQQYVVINLEHVPVEVWELSVVQELWKKLRAIRLEETRRGSIIYETIVSLKVISEVRERTLFEVSTLKSSGKEILRLLRSEGAEMSAWNLNNLFPQLFDKQILDERPSEDCDVLVRPVQDKQTLHNLKTLEIGFPESLISQVEPILMELVKITSSK